MKVRVSEQQGVRQRTEKPVRGNLSTSVRDHILVSDHHVAWKHLRILGSESNKFILELKESLFIRRDKPALHKNQFSQELLLF